MKADTRKCIWFRAALRAAEAGISDESIAPGKNFSRFCRIYNYLDGIKNSRNDAMPRSGIEESTLSYEYHIERIDDSMFVTISFTIYGGDEFETSEFVENMDGMSQIWIVSCDDDVCMVFTVGDVIKIKG